MPFDQKSWYVTNREEQRSLARARMARYRSLNLRLRREHQMRGITGERIG